MRLDGLSQFIGPGGVECTSVSWMLLSGCNVRHCLRLSHCLGSQKNSPAFVITSFLDSLPAFSFFPLGRMSRLPLVEPHFLLDCVVKRMVSMSFANEPPDDYHTLEQHSDSTNTPVLPSYILGQSGKLLRSWVSFALERCRSDGFQQTAALCQELKFLCSGLRHPVFLFLSGAQQMMTCQRHGEGVASLVIGACSQGKIAKLEADFEGAMAKQTELQDDMSLCEVKLQRAHKLIGGLGGEKARWEENVTDLTEQLALLPGDCIIAAGMVSYSGPFTSGIRSESEAAWLKELVKLNIAHNKEIFGGHQGKQPVNGSKWCSSLHPSVRLRHDALLACVDVFVPWLPGVYSEAWVP